MQGLLRFLILTLPLMIWMAGGAHAQDPVPPPDLIKVTEQQAARRQALEENRVAIERMREELLAQSTEISRRLATLQVGDVTEAMVEQARVDTKAARLRQQELQAEIAGTERRIKELEQSIRDLEAREQLLRNPARAEEDAATRAEQLERTRQALAELRSESMLENQHLENLRNRLELVAMRLSLAEQWQSRVEDFYQIQQEQIRREVQEDLESRLQRQRQTYLDRAAELSQRLERERDTLSPARQRRLETEIKAVEERANLIQLSIRLADIDNTLTGLDTLADKAGAKPNEIREGLRQLRNIRLELETSEELLQRKLELYRQQQQVIEQREDLSQADKALSLEEKKLIEDLLADLDDLNRQIQKLITKSEAVQTRLTEHYREILSRDLFARKALPATVEEWNQLLEGLAEAPGILLHQLRLSLESFFKSLAAATALQWLGFILAEAGALALLILLWRGLGRLSAGLRTAAEIGFSGRLVIFFSNLLHWNLWGIGIAATVLIAIWIFQIPQPGLGIITTLVLLWIGIKIPINLTWLVFASRHVPAKQRQPRLYRQWSLALFFGGILAALTILAHLSGVSEAVMDAFDRLFMVYLLVITLPVMRVRRLFIDLLAGHYRGQYWFIGLRLLTWLLPLSLAGIGILGLVGYLNLAWTVAWYLVVSIAILAIWLIAQGLIKDLTALMRSHTARHAEEELLWPQELVDPLYKIASIILFLGACTALVRIYGWDKEATFTMAWQIAALSVILIMAAYEGIYFLANRLVRSTESASGGALIRHCRQPLGFIVPIAAAQIIIPTLPIAGETLDIIHHVLVLAQIVAIAWLIIRLGAVMDDVVMHRYLVEAQDKQGARRVRTQMRMLRQILTFAVYLFAISAMLMTFPRVRQLGAGLLASAGVAGLVAGIAARPFLANLIAGVQIGLTQPIRLDDEVIVEDEWGRIEEINPTHVIIRIWDDRRLVVPLNYFNEKPFQNWTRYSTQLLGSVFVHVDYTFPIEEGRQELKRILDETDLWDGRAWVLQVTDSTPKTMELRLLVSARDAPTAWDLRCHVREKFIEFIQKNYPDCLPRTRTMLEGNLSQESEAGGQARSIASSESSSS